MRRTRVGISSLYSLLFAIFNDCIGWGLVLTIFAPLLFDRSNPILSPDTTDATRNLLLGCLIGVYAIAQFIALPLIGALSDHFGRKKLLEWALLGVAISFFLSGIAISIHSLALLFITRLLAGFFAANAGIAQASIADISTKANKAKNLSLGAIAGGISWIVGPPLGGFLSTPTWVSWFDFSTPFWFVGILFLINLLWVRLSFVETHQSKEKHGWQQEIKDLTKLSKISQMKGWLTATFLFYLGWGFFLLFYPTLLVLKFGFNQEEIGWMSGYLSLFWLIASLTFNRWLSAKVKSEILLKWLLPLMTLAAVLIGVTTQIDSWSLLIPVIAICGAICWISTMAVTSNLAGTANQGKVFGITQSLLALALFLSPILSGFLVSALEELPLYIGALSFLTAAILASCLRAKRSA